MKMVSLTDIHNPFKDHLSEPGGVKPKHLYTNFVSHVTDEVSASEKLAAAYRNIDFLQKEHALTLHGLHKEIEKLQNQIRELQFRKDVLEVIAPDNEFFNCDIGTLQKKVEVLIQDHSEMKRKLHESNRALETLDQKQKLEHWQHQQELADKEKTIVRLQQELEVKCSTVAELTAQLTQKRRGGFLRRFSFQSSETPSIIDTLQSLRASETAGGASSCSLPTESHSSHSSLSDRSISDEDLSRSPFFRKQYTFPSPKYGYRQRWWRKDSENVVHLPPIGGLKPKRPLVRQQLRVDKMTTSKMISDPLAIDNVSLPELVDKM